MVMNRHLEVVVINMAGLIVDDADESSKLVDAVGAATEDVTTMVGLQGCLKVSFGL